MSDSLTRPTTLVPGFMFGNPLFHPMRDRLRALGVDAESWKRAPYLYRRRIDWYGERLAQDLLKRAAPLKEPLTLVGWSEGGFVCVSAMRHLADAWENPHDIVRRVIAFGTPFDGTWAARVGRFVDPILGINVREMRPGSATIADQLDFLGHRRHWDFQAINGAHDLLAPAPQKSLDPAWRQSGPWNHRSPIADRGLLDLIHKLILLP